MNVTYLYVKGVGHFTWKYVGMYFNFRWKLGSAVDGQVGESILHVLIVYVMHQQDRLLLSQLRLTFPPVWME